MTDIIIRYAATGFMTFALLSHGNRVRLGAPCWRRSAFRGLIWPVTWAGAIAASFRRA